MCGRAPGGAQAPPRASEREDLGRPRPPPASSRGGRHSPRVRLRPSCCVVRPASVPHYERHLLHHHPCPPPLFVARTSHSLHLAARKDRPAVSTAAVASPSSSTRVSLDARLHGLVRGVGGRTAGSSPSASPRGLHSLFSLDCQGFLAAAWSVQRG